MQYSNTDGVVYMTQRKKSIKFKDRKLKELEDGLINNGMATMTDRKRNWTVHDLKTIHPINTPQQAMFTSYFSGNHIIANGSAGTGKSLAAIFLALCDVLSVDSPQTNLTIVRSAVPTRDLGALPGTLDEKLEPFEVPYKDIVYFLTGHPTGYASMKKSGLIKFMSTSFIRSLTWDRTVILIDEIQNLNAHEINSALTRVGEDSKVIIIGDNIQSDLTKSHQDRSGMEHFLRVARRMKEFDEIMFTKHDIVRSGFVKSWLCALEEELT